MAYATKSTPSNSYSDFEREYCEKHPICLVVDTDEGRLSEKLTVGEAIDLIGQLKEQVAEHLVL